MTDDELVAAVMNPDYRPPTLEDLRARCMGQPVDLYADMVAAKEALERCKRRQDDEVYYAMLRAEKPLPLR